MMAGALALVGRVSPKVWMGLGAVAVLIGLWFALMAWGNSRYEAGVTHTDAKWAEAGERLAAQVETAGAAADVKEAERIENHTERLAAEREKIDEAVAQGRSPLDALFPAG